MKPCAARQDAATAKALAFHREVRTRCITLEGDDFNPGGTLTGVHLITIILNLHLPATNRLIRCSCLAREPSAAAERRPYFFIQGQKCFVASAAGLLSPALLQNIR